VGTAIIDFKKKKILFRAYIYGLSKTMMYTCM
jgi:hypothetical protein